MLLGEVPTRKPVRTFLGSKSVGDNKLQWRERVDWGHDGSNDDDADADNADDDGDDDDYDDYNDYNDYDDYDDDDNEDERH